MYDNKIDISDGYITHNSGYVTIIEDIEDEIFYNLKDINNNVLYRKDCFKKSKHNIDIISPREVIPGYKSVITDPDTVRFMLSLYPYINDLNKISTIVLKPKHIEINGIQLVCLYLASEKLLVLYLHSPLLYNTSDIKFNEYAKILSYALFSYSEEKLNFNNDSIENSSGKNCSVVFSIPPLWYILSTVSFFHDNKIEKFFIRTDNTISNNISRKLSDISFHYSRLGY